MGLRKSARLSIAVCAAMLAAGAATAQVDDALTAKKRVFKGIGPGLRAVRKSSDGKYYVLASPTTGLAIFDSDGKLLNVIGAPPPEPVANKAGRSAIAFGEDCSVDEHGKIYVADRGYNLVNLFSPDGKLERSISVNSPLSVAALPGGEVAVIAPRQPHLVTVYGPEGRVDREFGNPEQLSTRDDLNAFLSQGRIESDPQGHLYYGYLYLPEPLVRQYDRFGFAGKEFEYTGLDAMPEGTALRREIEKQEKKQAPPLFQPVMTAFGVDPQSGELWMVLHNTLLHFDKDGNRRSTYQIYTPEGVRLIANTILVEENRLLIGSDPLGIFEFARPDKLD